MDGPIFEIKHLDLNKHYKIYEDGKIEGFEHGALIINRIPARINQVYASGVLSTSCPSNKPTSVEVGVEQGEPL